MKLKLVQFNGRPMWRDAAINQKLNIKAKPLTSSRLGTTYYKDLAPDVAPEAKALNNVFIPKMNGSPDWGERTSDGKKFVYTYR